jgi:hypothetical protein|nr:MAG TPA: hypothetical protein [Caudoviricetes sp.]
MIYFVNVETKERVEYDDLAKRIFSEKELPIDVNDIATVINEEKWKKFYATTTHQRSAVYSVLNPMDTACYLIMALVDITSLHYAAVNSISRGYVSKKLLGIIEPYNGRYGTGYKWFTNCPKSTKHKLVSYLVF